ncbi:hypothetical protein [Billgrantia montanilacus]|uniref:Uncharacterized protein n=1 Tax=Billgrantia montanilacus TaxID=2282305 RepID=A0A368TUM5_9GAMM|nr:hypothetical protein [Halomonas montanilacus]RCV88350.1 hypothetical protein DU505_13735 [Halomonas montanilacus]
MTTKDVTAIALRLFSLWLLVQVILNVPSLVLYLTTMEQYQEQIIPGYVYIAMIGGFIVVGLMAVYLIWLAAKSVLAYEAGGSGAATDDRSQTFLLQLGGVYFIVTSLAYLPRSLGFFLSSMEVSYVHVLSPLGLLFQLFIGLALVFNASWWVHLLARLRGRP